MKKVGCLAAILGLCLVISAIVTHLPPARPRWQVTVAGVERLDIPYENPGTGRVWLVVRTTVTNLQTRSSSDPAGIHEQDFTLQVDGQTVHPDHGAMTLAEPLVTAKGWGRMSQTTIAAGQAETRLLVFKVPVDAQQLSLTLPDTAGPVAVTAPAAAASAPTPTPKPTPTLRPTSPPYPPAGTAKGVRAESTLVERDGGSGACRVTVRVTNVNRQTLTDITVRVTFYTGGGTPAGYLQTRLAVNVPPNATREYRWVDPQCDPPALGSDGYHEANVYQPTFAP